MNVEPQSSRVQVGEGNGFSVLFPSHLMASLLREGEAELSAQP